MGSDLAHLEVECIENLRVKHRCSECSTVVYGPTAVQLENEGMMNYSCDGCDAIFRARYSEFHRWDIEFRIVG